MLVELHEALQRRYRLWCHLTDIAWWVEHCPIATRRYVRRLERENYSLRDALRNTNAELRKHRQLIGELRNGNEDVTAGLERAMAAARRGR